MNEHDIVILAFMLAIFGTIVMIHLSVISSRGRSDRRSTDMPWSKKHRQRKQ